MEVARIAICIINNTRFSNETGDSCAALLKELLFRHGTIIFCEKLENSSAFIQKTICGLADEGVADIIFTCGGTGIFPEDITPEITRAIIEREVPGIPEAMRINRPGGEGSSALLFRAIAGTRRKSMIINLPDTPSEICGAIEAILPIFPEILFALRINSSGETE